MVTYDVVIPAYNCEDTINRCLNSIPDSVSRIIIVNDASTDNTVESISLWSKNTGREVELYHNEVNLGVGHTINKAYDLVTADYVLRIDSDDHLKRGINEVISLLGNHDIVFFNQVQNDTRVREVTLANYHTRRVNNNKFIRTSFMGDIRGEPLRCGEDGSLIRKLAKMNPTTLFTKISAYHYNYPR